MEIIKASENVIPQYTEEIPALVWSTGPVAYAYQFGSRDFFDRAVAASWPRPGTLFGWDGACLALEGEDLLGLLISFQGPEFSERKAAMAGAGEILLRNGQATEEELVGLIERAEHARWLNPELRARTYYIHAIAVKPEHRGRQIGAKLMNHARKLAQELDCVALELDVLSDNPAVAFYRSQGLTLLAETRAPGPTEYGVPPEFRMGALLNTPGETP